MGYDLDAVALFAKRREFSRSYGSSDLRGPAPYYFLQVFERGVSFYRLAKQFSQGFGVFCRDFDGSQHTAFNVLRKSPAKKSPAILLKHHNCEDTGWPKDPTKRYRMA